MKLPSPPSLPAVAVGLLLALVCLAQMHPLHDTDLWWHVYGGREIVNARSMFLVDRSSFLMEGRTWEATEWAFEVLLWALWATWGAVGVASVPLVCAFLGSLLAWRLCRILALDHPWRGVAVVSLLAAATLDHYSPRPQSFFLVFLLASVWMLERIGRRETGLRDAVAGVLFVVVWAQIHASYVVFPAILACGVVDAALAGDRRRVVQGTVLVGLVSLATLLATPLGAGIVEEILDHAASDASRHVVDMSPLTWESWVPLDTGPRAWQVVLLIVAAVGLIRSRSARVQDVCLFLFGGAMALTANRFTAAWAILTLPVALRAPTGSRERAVPAAALALLCLFAAVPLSLQAMRSRSDAWSPGTGIWRPGIAEDAVTALRAAGLQGRLFNYFDDGGYLLFALSPERVRAAGEVSPMIKVGPSVRTRSVTTAPPGEGAPEKVRAAGEVSPMIKAEPSVRTRSVTTAPPGEGAPGIQIAIDSRTPTFYDENAFAVWRLATQQYPVFHRLEQAYDIQHALIRREDPVCLGLEADPRWRLIFVEGSRALFTRQAPESTGIPPIRTLSACGSREVVRCVQSPEIMEDMLRELSGLERSAPLSPWPHILRLRLATGCPAGGGPEEAVRAARTALRLGASLPEDLAAAAWAFAAVGETGEARAAIGEALRRGGTGVVKVTYARLLARWGEDRTALKMIEGAGRELGDRMSGADRLFFAQLLARSGDSQRASGQALRARWLGQEGAAALVLPPGTVGTSGEDPSDSGGAHRPPP